MGFSSVDLLMKRVALIVLWILSFHRLPALAYDPLAVSGEVRVEDFSVSDMARHREIPLRVYLPTHSTPAPVVVFSHGLGGSKEGSSFLGRHWASRGYIAIFLQHPGSDSGVWKEAPASGRIAAMNKAANAENFMLRVGDVHAVLDGLERWDATPGHPLYGSMDLHRVGMSGHSFGAVTTQAVSGQHFPVANAIACDVRINAAIAFSPSTPRVGDPAAAFGQVKIPWMLLTGTKDVSVIGNVDVASRLAVYPALPSGSKYELVLDGAQHSAFTDAMRLSSARNPNHHRTILAVTTAFWDASLKGDPEAAAWLNGGGPRSLMDPADRWRHK